MSMEDLHDLMTSTTPTFTLPQLAGLAARVLSPAVKHLVVGTLEAIRRNATRSRRHLDRAEASCTDDAELCYVLHLGAILLLRLGDADGALEKDKRSLELCDRLGYRRLQADVLSHLSAVYGALGHRDLAAAYAAEAARMTP
jgi:tetratricopeptide (TPR) repeat protein